MKHLKALLYGFFTGVTLTTGVIVGFSRLLNPRWYHDKHLHRYSTLIEELYCDHIKTGDSEYEIYEVLVTFDSNNQQAEILENGKEYTIYRKFW